jgi:hypothetical protein
VTVSNDYSLALRRYRQLLDVAVLVCVALVGWRLVDMFPARHAPPIERGAVLRLPGVDWAAADRNVALVMSSTCEATRANLSLYRQVAERMAAANRSRFLVIGQEPVDDIHRWLSVAGISKYVAVRTFNAADVGLTVTPMLLSVDASGVVSRVITGTVAEPAYEAIVEELLR